MTLKITKSITLNGSSNFNGETAMMFSASLRQDGATNLNASVVNQSVYEANKKQVQKDLSDFNVKVFEISSEVESISNTENKETSTV